MLITPFGSSSSIENRSRRMEPIELLRRVAPLVIATGVVSIVCSPILGVESVRSLIEDWPNDRLVVNYVLLVIGVVLGHWIVIVTLWQPLEVNSNLGRLLGIIVGYPVALWVVGAAVLRLRNRRRSIPQTMTPRAVAGLGLGVVLYIFSGLALAFILLLIGIFTALPT